MTWLSSPVELCAGQYIDVIGNNSFADCDTLSAVWLHDNVKSIGNGAFSHCENLKSVSMGEHMIDLNIDAFAGCTGLESVSMPSSVENIGERAFSGCNHISSMQFGEKLQTIGNSAFLNSSIESVRIPGSVWYIGNCAFNSPNLMGYVVEQSNNKYKSANGLLLNKDGSALLGGVNGGVVVADGVRSIEREAFRYCSGVSSVTMPQSVRDIEEMAFMECNGIDSLELGEGVERIAASAFYNCSGLSSVVLPESVSEIGERAFFGCADECKYYVFSDKASNELKESESEIEDSQIYLRRMDTRIRFGDDFANYKWRGALESEDLYQAGIKAQYTWISAPVEVETGYGISGFGDFVFSGCQTLETVNIVDSIRKIGNFAFAACPRLLEVSIPRSVEEIGASAFAANSLTGIFVDGQNGNYASENGLLLSKDGTRILVGVNGNVTCPDSVSSILDNAFCSCGNLSAINLNRVVDIGDSAFRNCGALRDIAIPPTISSIGNDAFSQCSGLQMVYIGEGVRVIGKDAFLGNDDGCIYRVQTYETSVLLKNSTPSIGDDQIVLRRESTRIRFADGQTSSYNWSGEVSYDALLEEGIVDQTSWISSPIDISFGYSVSAIGEGAFLSCETLSSIEIVNSISSINDHAFQYCHALVGVEIEDGVLSICDGAFNGCNGISSVNLPNSVEHVGLSAFNNANLTSFSVAANPNFVAQNNLLLTFDGGTVVGGVNGDVELPDGILSIATAAFAFNSNLSSVYIPMSVVGIGQHAFLGNHSECKYYVATDELSTRLMQSDSQIRDDQIVLRRESTRIRFADGQTSSYNWSGEVSYQTLVDDGLLSGRNGWISDVWDIDFGLGVTSIGSYLGGYGPRTVEIPPSVSSIAGEAFKNSRILSIDIPNSVARIGTQAFSNSGNLSSVVISYGLKTIEHRAFQNCTSLLTVDIPDSVTAIGPAAFEGCTNLSISTIPNGISSIAQNTFYGCKQITTMSIPQNVKRIDYSAFLDTNMESLTIENGCEEIDRLAFARGRIRTVHIPSSLKQIASAFNSEHIREISVDETNEFYKSYDGNLLTKNGRAFVEGVNANVPDGVEVIRGWAFYYSGLTQISLPQSLSSIEERTFLNSNLNEITIPDSVTDIGIDAFRNCYQLTSVVLPKNLEKIPEESFRQCRKLNFNNITFPVSLKRIDDYAFEHTGNSSAELNLPDGLESIGRYAFEYSAMSEVRLPDSLSSIGDGAFMFINGCSNIYLGSGLSANNCIGNYAFSIRVGQNPYNIHVPNEIVKQRVVESGFAEQYVIVDA